MSDVIETLAAALDARKRELKLCPARKQSLGDVPCPQCGSGTSEPCWLNVAADATLVDVVKEVVGAAARARSTQGDQ